jgi:hypothetical protein
MPEGLNCKKPVNVSLRYVEGYVYVFGHKRSWRKTVLNEVPTGLNALSVGAW